MDIYQKDFQNKSDAYNFCVKIATGMYIMQINPNEVLSKECLEVMFNELEIDPDFSLICGGKSQYRANKNSEQSKSLIEQITRIDTLNQMNFTKPILFRKRDWSRIGGFNNHCSDFILDFDFYYRLSEIGKAKQCFQSFFPSKNKNNISLDELDISTLKIFVNDILQEKAYQDSKLNIKLLNKKQSSAKPILLYQLS